VGDGVDSVTFEPGARTAWHTTGLDGDGYIRRRAGAALARPIEDIGPGDGVWFAPGEKHWHGASPTTAMTHIAIADALNGKVVDWMEHISDEQYRV
jgi:quercetin dioxygenase-like cupin family protein